jgi:hypothetical protein
VVYTCHLVLLNDVSLGRYNELGEIGNSYRKFFENRCLED